MPTQSATKNAIKQPYVYIRASLCANTRTKKLNVSQMCKAAKKRCIRPIHLIIQACHNVCFVCCSEYM